MVLLAIAVTSIAFSAASFYAPFPWRQLLAGVALGLSVAGLAISIAGKP